MYKLIREKFSNKIISEVPFIDNIDGKVVAGYRVEVKHESIEEIRDRYDYLAGCIDVGLEEIVRSKNGEIVFKLKCRNPEILGKISVEADDHVIIRLNIKEVMDKLLPKLGNPYVVRKIKAVVNGDEEEYHSIIRDESQADEVLKQLAVEEILFSNRREEYEKILSIKPEEAKFQQKLLRELVGCGR